MKTAVLHHDDPDGYVSAYIVGKSIHIDEYVEVNYNIDIVDIVKKYDSVYIVDLSMKEDTLKKLSKLNCDIIWIDHHKTSLNLGDYDNIHKIVDTSRAACELVWEFFNISEMPDLVKFVGDYDTWSKKFQESEYLSYYFRLSGLKPPNNPIWDAMADDINRFVNYGKIAMSFYHEDWKTVLLNMSFEVVMGEFYGLCLNVPHKTSLVFGDKINDYDFVSVFNHDGERFNVSLYSSKIDVSKLAVKNGGGGHKSAAGFSCNNLPWRKI